MNNLIFVLSIICSLVGLAGTAGYAVTLYLLFDDSLLKQDIIDAPYVYAAIECGLTAATFIIGLLTFRVYNKTRNLNNTQLRVILGLFFLIFFASGTFTIVRAYNLGIFPEIFGENLESTCNDVGILTGCPTTRFDLKYGPTIQRNITYTSPNGGDCVFWFWGPKMYTNAEMLSNKDALGGVLNYIPEQANAVGKWMDWSNHESYGWRTHPDQLNELVQGSTGILEEINNLQQIYSLTTLWSDGGNTESSSIGQQTKINIPPSETISSVPMIEYCWNWGCHAICTRERFLINRWWFFSSSTLTILYLMCIILTSCLMKKETKSNTKASGDDGVVVGVGGDDVVVGVGVGPLNSFQLNVEEVGRRRRFYYRKSDSGLQF